MPFSRPSLTDLRTQVAQDIASALPGSDPLLRFSNLGIICDVLAGLAHLHYGYLDWTAQQAQPFTATDEYLEAWAALKGVTRIAAARASGTVTFTGTDGTVLPAGTQLVRGDGVKFTTAAEGTVATGTVAVDATADADPQGLTGAFGNTDTGSAMTIGTAISGINSTGVVTTAFTGGADIEGDEALRSRMLLAYQEPSHGGSHSDYIRWARSVAGVTRAWCLPHADGAGTVAVYVMLDAAQAIHDGFPQGTDGVATDETRATVATGDQLAVANAIYPLQPVTALVRVYAPAQNAVAFTISGLSGASTGTKDAVAAAITQVLLDFGQVGAASTTVSLSYVQSAVAAVPGTAGFLITVPAGNITSAAGHLPTLGAITWI